MQINITNSWKTVLSDELNKDYFKQIETFVDEASKTKTVYPEQKDIFAALNATNFEDVKVVILGQDPYHGEGQAHGLAFSVNKGITIPPSLRNMFKEINDDIGRTIIEEGCLTDWANQGVLLLNTVLTVEKGNPNSHSKIGWQKFTDKIISLLNSREKPVVFILWGGNARKKVKLITNSQHLILEGPHPSPLSSYRGFFGCKHFSKTNDFLLTKKSTTIKW